MRLRSVAFIATTAGAVAGVVYWRRRRRHAVSLPPVQLGLADGSLEVPDKGDPVVAVLEVLAADVRRALPVAQ